MLQDVGGAIFWHTPELGRIQDLGAAPTESIQEFTLPGCYIVRMWVSPGYSSFHDLTVSSMWQFPGCFAPQEVVISGCRILQPVVISRIFCLTGFGLFQDLSDTPQYASLQDVSCCLFQDVAVSRIWQCPGIFLSQEVAFTRIWPHTTFGLRGNGRGSIAAGPRSRKRSVAAGTKSWRPR